MKNFFSYSNIKSFFISQIFENILKVEVNMLYQYRQKQIIRFDINSRTKNFNNYVIFLFWMIEIHLFLDVNENSYLECVIFRDKLLFSRKQEHLEIVETFFI